MKIDVIKLRDEVCIRVKRHDSLVDANITTTATTEELKLKEPKALPEASPKEEAKK